MLDKLQRLTIVGYFEDQGRSTDRFEHDTLYFRDGTTATQSEIDAALGLDLTGLRAAKADAVNAKRDAVVGAGYRHNFGGTAGWRTLDQRDAKDETAWLTVERKTSRLVEAGAGDTAVEIRDARNATFTTSALTAATAMDAMGGWRMAVSAHSWSLKDAIEDAEDQAALDAIDILTGWPGTSE